MKNIMWILIVGCLVSGCTTTQKGTSAGALGGATIGGILGHQAGKGAEGAAIGGVVGAIGGYLVGDKMKVKFCPTGGKAYDESVSFCPIHGVELKYKEKK